jgi:hypothetical protein
MASKVFGKVIISVLVLFVLLTGALVYGLQQPRFVAGAVHYFLKKSPPNLDFKEITIEKIHWSSWKDLSLHNVRVRCKINKDTYFFSFGSITIDELNGLLGSTPLRYKVEHLAIVSDLINASDMDIEAQANFQALKFQNTAGSIHMANLELYQYALKPIKSDFKGTLSHWELSNIQSRFYQGSIQGSIMMDLKPKMRYTLQAQIEQVDLEVLASANPSAFKDMRGKVSGSISGKASAKTLQELKIDLRIPGGYIPSNILGILARGFLPEGVLRQPFDRALENQVSIPFESASVFVEMVGAEIYKAKVNILSPKASIDLNTSYDINMDGGPYEILSVLKLIHPN